MSSIASTSWLSKLVHATADRQTSSATSVSVPKVSHTGSAESRSECRHAADVIAVLVCDDDRGQRLRLDAERAAAARSSRECRTRNRSGPASRRPRPGGRCLRCRCRATRSAQPVSALDRWKRAWPRSLELVLQEREDLVAVGRPVGRAGRILHRHDAVRIGLRDDDAVLLGLVLVAGLPELEASRASPCSSSGRDRDWNSGRSTGPSSGRGRRP